MIDRYDPPDPERFRLPEGQRWSGEPSLSTTPPRHKRGEPFLKGPIPLDWLGRAAGLRGKSPVVVALALWFQAGVDKRRTVSLTGSLLGRFGSKRHSGYRGLVKLEQAGLVSVDRRPGRSPVVTLLDAAETEDCGGNSV